MNPNQLPGRKFQQGFSLLELLLALLILTILILAAVGQYRRYQKYQEIEAIKHNITLLKEAANVFYQYQCTRSDASFKNRFEPEAFNIQRVKSQVPFLLLPSNLVSNTSSDQNKTVVLNGYEIYAEIFGSPIYLPKGSSQDNAKVILYPYRLKLKVTFAEPVTDANLLWYQSVLGATDIQGKQLIWDYLPSAPKPKTGSQLWITETGLQQFRKRAVENFSVSKGVKGVLLQCAY